MTKKEKILDFILKNWDIEENYSFDYLKQQTLWNNANVFRSFQDTTKAIYQVLFDTSIMPILSRFFEKNLDLMLEKNLIYQDQIFELYNSSKKIKNSILTKELFLKKMKCLFFDEDLNNKNLQIKLDILVILLFEYLEILENKYINTFFYNISNWFFWNYYDKNFFSEIVKIKWKSKTETFLYILENYDNNFTEERLQEINKSLGLEFIKKLKNKEKVYSNIIDIKYTFWKNNFKIFIENNIECFQIWFICWVFYFNLNTFIIREDFFNLFLKKEEKTLITIPEKSLEYNFSINNDIFTDKNKIKSYNIYELFYETLNINKKTIWISKTELNIFLNKLKSIDIDSIDYTIKNILIKNTKSLVNYTKNIWQTILNLWLLNEETLEWICEFKFWETLLEDFNTYKNQFIDYNSFKEKVFIKNSNLLQILYTNA